MYSKNNFAHFISRFAELGLPEHQRHRREHEPPDQPPGPPVEPAVRVGRGRDRHHRADPVEDRPLPGRAQVKVRAQRVKKKKKTTTDMDKQGPFLDLREIKMEEATRQQTNRSRWYLNLMFQSIEKTKEKSLPQIVLLDWEKLFFFGVRNFEHFFLPRRDLKIIIIAVLIFTPSLPCVYLMSLVQSLYCTRREVE